MDENATREANLRAIHRLLDYAIVESRRVGVPEVSQLLTSAMAIIGGKLRHTRNRPPPSEPLGTGKLRLVACRDTLYKKGNESKV